MPSLPRLLRLWCNLRRNDVPSLPLTFPLPHLLLSPIHNIITLRPTGVHTCTVRLSLDLYTKSWAYEIVGIDVCSILGVYVLQLQDSPLFKSWTLQHKLLCCVTCIFHNTTEVNTKLYPLCCVMCVFHNTTNCVLCKLPPRNTTMYCVVFSLIV